MPSKQVLYSKEKRYQLIMLSNERKASLTFDFHIHTYTYLLSKLPCTCFVEGLIFVFYFVFRNVVLWEISYEVQF